MNYQDLLKLKNIPEFKYLDKNFIDEINKIFSGSNIKTKKYKNKTSNNIFKTTKFNLDKNKIKNKIILILNKVSELNINNLTIEYLKNIELENESDFIDIQIEFYKKMIKDIDLLEYYYLFMINIFSIVKSKYNFQPDFFINILKDKILDDYTSNHSIKEENSFIQDYTKEILRVNNLEIIKFLISKKFFNNELSDVVSNYLLNQNQNKHIPDIYYWFNNLSISNSERKNIQKKSSNEKNMRNKILLEKLIEGENNCIKKIKLDKNISNIEDNKEIEEDTLIIQIKNIIEEYIYLKSVEEVFEFIKDECKSPIHKNLFCKIIFYYFFNSCQQNENYFIKLLDILIKKRILFKSNLSRGLITFSNEFNINNSNKIKLLLLYLKSNNITKNIEYMFKKYNIKLSYANSN